MQKYYCLESKPVGNRFKIQCSGIEQDGDKKACCGAGDNPYNYNPNKFCSRQVQVCENPNKRVSWDGVHMTQSGNRYVANWLLKQFVYYLQ